MRSLIVEDNPTNRKLMQNILLPLGDCDTASDGLEAIQAFEKALAETNKNLARTVEPPAELK